jgi:histidinol dehydrogenase
MFAYGVGSCERVDLVTGPGSIWTVTAKRLLKGRVGIDSEAGPTEILVLADETADPAYVAADLLSQAEHDPLAAAVLVTDSEELADRVAVELDAQVLATKHTERIQISLSGPQSGVVLVDDLDQGVDVANAYAAEHLELHTADAAGVAGRIHNAGAIFVGPHAPVSLGDYCAAPTTCCPPAAARATPRGCRCGRSPSRCMSLTTRARPWPRSPATSSPSPRPRTLPGHGAAVRARFGG